MVKETHTKGGYLLALLALPFIDNEYLSSYEPVYKFILLFIYMYFSYIGSIIPDIDMRGSCASTKPSQKYINYSVLDFVTEVLLIVYYFYIYYVIYQV